MHNVDGGRPVQDVRRLGCGAAMDACEKPHIRSEDGAQPK